MDADADAIPRVFLGMPRYGDVCPGAFERFLVPSADPGLLRVVVRKHCLTSLTPHTFNVLFAEALDRRDAGEVTHFAMIHSDIWPMGPWLDCLMGQLQALGLAAISAVVPIKSDEGKTSTAVGATADPWSIRRYITLDDRRTLPHTFATADVARADDELLLINTGLMLLDLRHAAWDDFSFRFTTRIARGDDGRRKAEVRPEDWEMARFLHARGLPYAANWSIPLDHYGPVGWPSF